MKGLVGFARQSGVTTIAEGVESSYELATVRAIGVDLVQGYLIARPDEGCAQPRPVSPKFLTNGEGTERCWSSSVARAKGPTTNRSERGCGGDHDPPLRHLRIAPKRLCRARGRPAVPVRTRTVADPRWNRAWHWPDRVGFCYWQARSRSGCDRMTAATGRRSRASLRSSRSLSSNCRPSRRRAQRRHLAPS